MRILYVCLDRGIPVGGTKGASIHVGELVRAFRAEGHDVAVVARRVEGGPAERVFRAGPSEPEGFARVPGRVLRRDLREVAARRPLATAVRGAIESFRPALVYERYALFRTEGRAEAARSGLPFVLEVNAPLVWEESRFRGLALTGTARRAELAAWRGADLVVVPSEPLAARIRALGQSRVLVVPNAVDVELFSPDPRGPATRSSLGLDGGFVVAFAGSLKAWHDLDTLVRALAALPAERRAVLLIVGDGPARKGVERLAGSLGVKVVFAGAVAHADVPRYLAAADACVAGLPPDPQFDYFSPLKALEYLACGRPTVVADRGDVAGLARSGAALAYRPGDPDDLAERLELIASSPDLAGSLGASGRALAQSHTWQDAASAILQAALRLPRTASSA